MKLIKRLWQTGELSTMDYLVQLKQSVDTQTAGFELRKKLWQSAFKWMKVTESFITWLNLNLIKTQYNQIGKI